MVIAHSKAVKLTKGQWKNEWWTEGFVRSYGDLEIPYILREAKELLTVSQPHK